MNKLPEFDESKLLKNPYSFTLRIEVTKNVESTKFRQDAEGVMHPVVFYTEKQQTTKIYHAAGMLDIVSNLSDKASRLYLYIMYNLDSGKDYVRINPERYMKKNSLKDNRTLKGAIKELIRYSFIVATEFEQVYWINPNIFYSGSRIEKYPECKIVKGERIW